MPEHWEKVFTLTKWGPVDIAFSDSDYGLIIVDSGYYSGTVRTTDGGLTWQLNSLRENGQSGELFQRSSYHCFDLPTREDAYFFREGSYALISHDSGFNWKLNNYDNNVPPMVGYTDGCNTRIFSNGTGFDFVSLDTSLHQDRDTVFNIMRTNDYGFSFLPVPIQTGQSLNGHKTRDQVFLDTLEFWVSDVRGWMKHTTDGGYSWSVLPVIDSLSMYCNMTEIIPTSDRERLYVLFNAPLAPADTTAYPDFAATTNGGLTWRIDSSLHGARMDRLASQSPDKLWAFVGHGQYGGNVSLLHPYKPVQYCDSLFYSPDGGLSWSKDSTTFIGDTLVEMVWPDSNHGYIVAWRDTTMLVYRWVPNGAGAVAPARTERPFDFSIQPNPASGAVTIQLGGTRTAKVEIFDLLGNSLVTLNGTTNIIWDGRDAEGATVPAGVYLVRLSGVDRKGNPFEASRKIAIEK
jgi:hypothetical protein